MGRIRVFGIRFEYADTGELWVGRLCSDFALLQRFIAGEDIRPIVRDRQSIGAQGHRVFCMYGRGIGNIALGPLDPGAVPAYYSRVREFCSLLWSMGQWVELVACADLEEIPLNPDDHLSQLYQATEDLSNVFLEICNEPFKNGLSKSDLRRLLTIWRPYPVASGDYDITWDDPAHPDGTLVKGDYVTWHSDRGNDWPKEPKGGQDIRNGDKDFIGAHCPIADDEGEGAADTNQPGRRSNVPEDFRFYGANSALFNAWCTFHSDCGIASVIYTAPQRACAVAFFQGAYWPPKTAQFARYQRGESHWKDGNPANGQSPTWPSGVGDMPIVHNDLTDGVEPAALRTYCKDGYCVATRPSEKWIVVSTAGHDAKADDIRGFVRAT